MEQLTTRHGRVEARSCVSGLLMDLIARDNTPERLVSASRAEEEQGFELKLRPRWLGEFIGQLRHG